VPSMLEGRQYFDRNADIGDGTPIVLVPILEPSDAAAHKPLKRNVQRNCNYYADLTSAAVFWSRIPKSGP
jgi:hypothetical protein